MCKCYDAIWQHQVVVVSILLTLMNTVPSAIVVLFGEDLHLSIKIQMTYVLCKTVLLSLHKMWVDKSILHRFVIFPPLCALLSVCLNCFGKGYEYFQIDKFEGHISVLILLDCLFGIEGSKYWHLQGSECGLLPCPRDLVHLFGFRCHRVNVYLEAQFWAPTSSNLQLSTSYKIEVAPDSSSPVK